MMARDRQILAQMGIELWIPRQMHVCTQPEPLLWRDQLPLSEIQHSVTLNRVPTVPAAIEIAAQVVTSEPIPPTPQPVQQQPTEVVQPQSPQSLSGVQRFSWHAVLYADCIIIVDTQQLSTEVMALWENIQRLSTASVTLQWPFAWEQLQDIRGLASYIEGFIDGFAISSPRLLCLGEGAAFEHLIQQHQAELLPSLEHMRETPALKKRLWEAMRRSSVTRKI